LNTNVRSPPVADPHGTRHVWMVKVYAIRPTIDVFDGTGTLTPAAARAIDLIAQMVADVLQAGGDTTHQAVVWEGPSDVDTPPTHSVVADRAGLIALARRLLDPNDPLGGDIRSGLNCRSATFGQDGQAIVCLRHEDTAPIPPVVELVSVAERSKWLVETDLLDGSWPVA
jgi:hypothetical protein